MMTRNKAKKRLKYYMRIYRKSETGNDVDIIKSIDKLRDKKFSTLPRRIRHRLHKTGKHLVDLIVYTADVMAFYKSPEGADIENFFV
jgi:hypothetical protein